LTHEICWTFNRGLTTVRRCWKLLRSAVRCAEESPLDSEPEGGTILQPVVPAIILGSQCFSKISDKNENMDVRAGPELHFDLPRFREFVPKAKYFVLQAGSF
jgi:hypothetical protein